MLLNKHVVGSQESKLLKPARTVFSKNNEKPEKDDATSQEIKRRCSLVIFCLRVLLNLNRRIAKYSALNTFACGLTIKKFISKVVQSTPL
jgi:hypothetical protein